MDVRLFAAVMARFRKTAIVGLLAAVALAGVAYMRAGGTPVYQAQSEVLLTQADDPYGGPTASVVQEGGYLSGLPNVYSALANGDALQALNRHAAGVKAGTVAAAEVIDPPTGNVEPLITLTSSATTPGDAVKLAESMPAVLQRYVASEQTTGHVPTAQRVELVQVKNGAQPQLASSTSVTLPVLVFIAVLGAFVTLIFMLENLKPKTAEKLGRVTRPAESGGELALVLAALVQNLQSAPGSAPVYTGGRNGHDGASQGALANGHSVPDSSRSGPIGPVPSDDGGARGDRAQQRNLSPYVQSIRVPYEVDRGEDDDSIEARGRTTPARATRWRR